MKVLKAAWCSVRGHRWSYQHMLGYSRCLRCGKEGAKPSHWSVTRGVWTRKEEAP